MRFWFLYKGHQVVLLWMNGCSADLGFHTRLTQLLLYCTLEQIALFLLKYIVMKSKRYFFRPTLRCRDWLQRTSSWSPARFNFFIFIYKNYDVKDLGNVFDFILLLFTSVSQYWDSLRLKKKKKLKDHDLPWKWLADYKILIIIWCQIVYLGYIHAPVPSHNATTVATGELREPWTVLVVVCTSSSKSYSVLTIISILVNLQKRQIFLEKKSGMKNKILDENRLLDRYPIVLINALPRAWSSSNDIYILLSMESTKTCEISICTDISYLREHTYFYVKIVKL